MRVCWKPDLPILIFRLIAGTAILFHIRLLAGELADSGFFLTAIILAGIIGTGLALSSIRWGFGLLVLISLPAVGRVLLVAFEALAAGGQTEKDFLLFAYDRNFFVATVPLLWAGVSGFFSTRSRKLLVMEAWFNGIIFTSFFVIWEARIFGLYEQPVVLASVAIVLVVLECFVLIGSRAKEGRGSLVETCGVLLIVSAVAFFVALSLLKPIEDQSTAQGGGLLKPAMLRFDFSQYVRLESEISLSDDLALIVRKESSDHHTLLRRFVLSDYDVGKGFERNPEIDEKEHPVSLPNVPTELDSPNFLERLLIAQEYYLVNLDAAALVGMNAPLRINPYRTWDASSFSSAYLVESRVSDALPFELIDSVQTSNYEEVIKALGEADYRRLTDYGNDDRYEKFALDMTKGAVGYWDRVQAVYEKLKFGDYRYSLKPGIAADGDPLGRFLFESKKGYCSYFAFSMAILLRSMGIPARIAVGFYIDPAYGAFDYYPVRSDMAHAWVEVFFPGYGWIEYDPTTEQLAAGEEVRFDSSTIDEQFERLIKEILANRNGLSPRGDELAHDAPLTLQRAIRLFRSWLDAVWPILVFSVYLSFAFWRRAGFFIKYTAARKVRKKAVHLANHVVRRVELAGLGRKRDDESRMEFANRIDADEDLGLASIEEMRSAARFALSFESSDLSKSVSLYNRFSSAYRKRINLWRRVLLWVFPFAIFRKNARIALVLILLSLSIADVPIAQVEEPTVTADALFQEAEALIEKERWDQAVGLLKEGESAFPLDIRFSLRLGDLFSDRDLYRLAWDEYRTAEGIDPMDPALLHRLAITAGKLNTDAVAAEYLERLVALRPDDRDAIGDLAWMYFKLHRLKDGERVLLDAIQRLGSDPGFSMTLGTIYSDLYKYDESKRWYEESVAAAEKDGARTFAAVAHYNLSILESKFYNYVQAFRQTDLSLEAADRSSGHLARGELFLQKLDFVNTYTEYERAYELDVSPLSKLNMADAFILAGRTSDALVYAEKTLGVSDLSWMINYGTTVDQFKRDIHQVLADIFKGKANREAMSPRSGIAEHVSGLLKRGEYSVRFWVHRWLFREYSRRVGVAYERSGQRLDALLNYSDAFSGYPDRAIRYLDEARKIETELVPESEAKYQFERGRVVGDPASLLAAIADFDPVWQRDMIAEAYTELARLSPRRSRQKQDAIERLFALNTGMLPVNGLSLPVILDIDAAEAFRTKNLRMLASMLDAAGFERVPEGRPGRYRLRIFIDDSGADCELTDTQRGSVRLRRVLSLRSFRTADLASFSSELASAVFGGN